LPMYPILLPFVSQSSEDRFAICEAVVMLVMRDCSVILVQLLHLTVTVVIRW